MIRAKPQATEFRRCLPRIDNGFARGLFLTSTRVTMPRSRRRRGVKARALASCSHQAPTRRSGQVKEPSLAPGSQACRCVYRDRGSRTVCHRLWQHLLRERQLVVRLRKKRQGHQDRPRLRRRRPWRPVLQRLRRARRRQGREGVRRLHQGADGQDLRDRGRPRAAPDRRWPRPATTRSSASASPTARLDDKVAAKYPKTTFGIIDSVVEAKNVDSIVFTEEQGSYLAGVAAALKTKTGPGRLHRRRGHPADPEVRGGLRAGRQGHQPQGQGRRRST